MAIDRTVRKHIEDVVREWVAQGKMFSAFEVSLAVKERGVQERHRNLRDTVHQIVAEVGGANGYSRTLCDVGAPVHAWVYHRLRDNPYAYEPLDRSGMDEAKTSGGRGGQRGAASTPASTTRQGASDRPLPTLRNPQPLRAGAPLPATAEDGAFGIDREGSLAVPNTMLSRLGVAAGEKANIAIDAANQELRITRPSVLDRSTPDATLDVQSDGALRLAAELLDRAGLGGMQCYHIDGRGNLITVRAFATS
jgi:hypothetical protein